MRQEGTLRDWDDDKGFGFVQVGEGRSRVFAHIRDFEGEGRRPVNGDRLSFEPGQDPQGRPRATRIRFRQEAQAVPGASLWAGTAMAAPAGASAEPARVQPAHGRIVGVVTEWNDERGFGFVSPVTGGERHFLHIKAMQPGQRRPARGNRVTCRVVRDDKGKWSAEDVRLDLPLSARLTAVSPVVVFTGLFVLALAGLILAGRLPVWLGGFYLLASLTTFVAYAIDKSAARNNRWRTQESTLHLLALAGGWPGALAAQRLLRHKSVKAEFRRVFWLTVALNVMACGAYALYHGKSMASPLYSGCAPETAVLT